MKKIHILLLAIPLGLFGCKDNQKNSDKKQVNEGSEEVIAGYSSEDSLSWKGTYQGLVPCASCPGILTTVKLYNDQTFEKSDFYLDSEDGYFEEKGNFTFSEDGDKITMTSEKDTVVYNFGENQSEQLSKEEKEISSEITNLYILSKLSDSTVEFSNKPVKGFFIMGDQVASFEPIGSSKIYWINDSKDGSLAKLYNQKTKNQNKPYTPLMAELVLKVSESSNENLERKYEGKVDVIEIKSLANITLENYKLK